MISPRCLRASDLPLSNPRNKHGLDIWNINIRDKLSDVVLLVSSAIHNTRNNISCPVSPIGSPLLHPRSPQHLNGRLSPPPISSPHAMSGSSTPLTGGNGAIPFHLLNQSVYLQEGFGSKPTPPQSPYANSPSYHSQNHDMFRGMPSGSQIFRELLPNENDALGKQFGRTIHGAYDGQSVLADRVSQQLLRDHLKANSSLDLRPCTQLPDGMNGI